MASDPEKTEARDAKRQKIVEGVVVSDRMDKSISVVVERTEQHRRYKKYVRRRTKYMAHDEKNEAREGDRVRISQARPLSKQKRWRLVEIVRRTD